MRDHRFQVHRDVGGYAVFDTAEDRVVFANDAKATAIAESQRRNGWLANGSEPTYAAQVRGDRWRT